MGIGWLDSMLPRKLANFNISSKLVNFILDVRVQVSTVDATQELHDSLGERLPG
jgi:hypothetical protein